MLTRIPHRPLTFPRATSPSPGPCPLRPPSPVHKKKRNEHEKGRR